MAGKKRGPPGGKTTAPSMSILEKLKILRSLSCGFSESDLSNCLRQSGYQVDIAAEKLVTGQYRPLKKRSNNNPTHRRGEMPTTKTTTAYSSNANATPRQAAFSQQRHLLLTPSSSTSTGSQHHTVDSSTKDHRTPLASKSKKSASTRVLASSSSILVTPKSATPAAKSMKGRSGKFETEIDDWLLCQRWIGDGVNLQRGGACDYEEEFHVLVKKPLLSPTVSSISQKGLRFRSTSCRMDGSFPRHLSFLGPLLRNQLIKVKATALMEEHRLPIGAQVAFSLSVWIIDLARFFAVFGDFKNGHIPSYSKQFFASATAKANTNTTKGGPKTGSPHESCREAAFSMLQWAQYGKLPSSPPQETTADNNQNHDDDKHGDEVVESNEDIGEGDIDAEASIVRISAEDEEAAIPHWARQLDGSNDGNSDIWTGGDKDDDVREMEMDTPFGFREGIQLRPYQKRSLYWMTQREKMFGSGRNKLVRLLRELANESSKMTNTGSKEDKEVCVLGSRKKISCDCGPVVVDTNLINAPSVSKTFATDNSDNDNLFAKDQELDHPLWERRFLCNEKRMEALSFYVQPTFRNAAAEPPPPPLPCRGGILADSMGYENTETSGFSMFGA